MKNLNEYIKEFINEARVYKPKFNPADWAKALKELNKGAKDNYSQVRGMESTLRDDYYSTSEEWVEEIYNNGFDPNHEFKDVITDIANFFIDNWRYYGFEYKNEQDDIDRYKSNMSNCDFGIEEKEWYTFYEYIGPSSMKKYAEEIAKVANLEIK